MPMAEGVMLYWRQQEASYLPRRLVLRKPTSIDLFDCLLCL